MDFQTAFLALVGNEGGYVNDPRDPGGETKYGISKRAYPNEDIANLTLDQAQAIYQRDYWVPAGCDVVPDAIKFDVFDTAVNSGVRAAIKMIQGAVGQTTDGILGPLTLQALKNMPADRAGMRFNAGRLLHYASDDNWPAFGRGWVRRVAANMMRA